MLIRFVGHVEISTAKKGGREGEGSESVLALIG